MELSAANSRFFRRVARVRPGAGFRAVALAAISTLSFNACSMGLFSDGKDASVLAQKPYRPGNSLCANIDIRSNDVSVPQFRELLACLNSNGSLAEVQKLTDLMTDEELLPLVRVGNEQFFKNPVYLYQFEKTFSQWVAQGLITEDLDQIGALIRNDAWVRSLLAMMAKADPKLYPALELIARDLGSEKLARTFEALVSFIESPAFKSLQEQLRKPGQSPLSIEEMARSIMAYIRAQRAPGRVDVDRRVLRALADGSLFRVLDDFSLSLSPAGDLRETVAKFSALSNQLSARESRLFGIGPRRDAERFLDLLGLVNGMHAPISCLKGTQVVPDGVMFVLRELSSRSTQEADHFLRRENLLNLSLLSSICEFPEALTKHYSALQSLSSTDTLFTAVEFAKSFYRNGAAEFLVDSLGGEGSGAGLHSSLLSPMADLMPVLSELSSRGAMEDLYLLASSIRLEDRARWQEFFSFLVEGRAELDGSSIYDVLYDTIIRADENLIADLMHGFDGFMSRQDDVFAPALRSMRRVILMNNVHPILDVFIGMLKNSTQNRDFFEAVFKMARKHPSEFEGAIRLVGDMTREDDGRLKDVIAATVRVFSKFAAKGESAGKVEKQEVPSFDPVFLRAHQWSRKDLVAVVPQLLPEWKGCSGLSPTVRLDLYENPAHADALDQYLQCLDSDGKHADIVSVLHYLRGEKTSAGKPLLHHWLDQMHALDLSPTAIQQVIRSFFNLYDEGTLFRAVDVLPWWLSYDFDGGKGSAPSTLLSPLIDVIGGIVRKAGDSLVRIEKFAGALVPEDSVPGALEFVNSVMKSQPAVTPFTDTVAYPVGPFQAPLWQYECLSRPSDQAARADRLVRDYQDAVTAWRVDSLGRPRYEWSKNELRNGLAPLAQKFGDPGQGPVLAKLVDFIRMVSLQPGERPVQGRLHQWSELRDWLTLRASDSHLIPYFYPGEENPRLKMASTLDLFELLVINADFNVILPENFALKFLGLVGRAWGDEPRSLWPADIQQMYARGGRPQTLREAFKDIKSMQGFAEALIGYPDLPDCPRGRTGQHGISLIPLAVKARVFNLSQILSVIERNLPDSSGPYRGGMKILRDILYQLWSSTPSKHRGTGDGWKNNLSVGPALARLGAFRQVSRAVRLAILDENQGAREGDRVLDAVLEGLVTAASQEHAVSAANGVFGNDPGNRFFFSLLDFGYDLLVRPQGQQQIRESMLYGVAALRSPVLADGLVQNASMLFWNNRQDVLNVLPVAGDLLASARLASTIRSFESWQPQSQVDLDARRDFDDILQKVLRATVDGTVLSVDALRLLSVLATTDVKAPWDEFIRRKDLLETNPDYSALRASGLLDVAIEFLTEKDPKTAVAAHELRQYLGGQLASGQLHEYLLWIGRDPDGVRRFLAAVGRASSNGDLKGLLRFARRALPDPR
jgi:hypothetical protein